LHRPGAPREMARMPRGSPAPRAPEPAPPPRGPLRFLFSYFVRGLLFALPLAATVWVVITVFGWLDGLIVVDPKRVWNLPLIGEVQLDALAGRGGGIVILVVVVTLIGFLTSNVLTGWVARRIENVITHVPVVKLIYSAIRDVIQAFLSEEKKFDRPVLLSFSETPEVEVIGFVTREDLSEFGRPGKVAVYVPQSYNFAANLILVPKDRVTPIDLPAADVMAFVVSGGVSQSTRKGANDTQAD